MKEFDAKKVTEKDVEEYLRDKVKAIGGRAYKWTSPGNVGVPDRIVLLPGSRIVFVELKAPGKKPTANQIKQLKFLRSLGFTVMVIDTKTKVDMLIRHAEAFPHIRAFSGDFITGIMKEAGVMTEF